MSLQTLFQLGIQTVAPRKSQTEDNNQEELVPPMGGTPFVLTQAAPYANRQALSRPTGTRQAFYMPIGREHARQHPSLSFIHDRSLRYGI